MPTRYYHYDGLGSTQLLTDENANITDSYCNTAFGSPVDTGAENPTPNPFQFLGRQGYYLDPDTGNYYVRARTLSPVMARWLSQDPRGLGGGDANLYRYVGNSPPTFSDASGEDRYEMWNGFHYWIAVDDPDGTGVYELNFWCGGFWWNYTKDRSVLHTFPNDPIWVYKSNRDQDRALIEKWKALAREDAAFKSGEWSLDFMWTLSYAVGFNCLTVTLYWIGYGGSYGDVLPDHLYSPPPPQPPRTPSSPIPGPQPVRDPESYHGGCFLPGTLVHTYAGLRAIESVQYTDLVWSFNKGKKEWELKRVTNVHEHQHTGAILEIAADGFCAKVTAAHCFWVARGDNLDRRAQRCEVFAVDYSANDGGRWLSAESLMAGDVLLGRSGRAIEVDVINRMSMDTKVYNLTVENVSNYAIQQDGVLVHNVKSLG